MSETGAAPARERLPRLSRNVYVVSAVSFLQDTASEILYPVLPAFVVGVLGAPPAALGVIEGLADGVASGVKLGAGRLADRSRRRPLIASGYTLSAIGKLLLLLAVTWPLVLVARCTDRVGKGLRGPPRDALITDETTPADRGRAFGFHRAADTAGAVVGPLLGLAVYEAVGRELRPMFAVALVPAFGSAALVLAIREHPHQRPAHHGAAAARDLPAPFWRVLGLLGLFALVNFPDTMLLLRAGDLGLGVPGVVGAYVLYNLVYAGLSYPAGRLSDRVPRPRLVAAGLAVFSLVYLGFGLTTSPAWVWALLPAYGVYTALTDGVGRAWIADLAPPGARGTALGVHAAVNGVGLVVAGLWAGLTWNGTGHVPFLVSGVAVAVLVPVLLFGTRGATRPVEIEPA